MGWNLTAPTVGFHIKLHGNTQILTLNAAPVVLARQKLTIALTYSVKFKLNLSAVGFWDLKLL